MPLASYNRGGSGRRFPFGAVQVQSLGLVLLMFFFLEFFVCRAAAQIHWQVLRVDSVQVFATSADLKNAAVVVRHLTLDGLPIADDLGTHRLPVVDVYIAPDAKVFQSLVGSALPDWAGAVAIPEARRIVLKSPRWSKDADLVETLLHELTHLIVADVARGAAVPAWLNEGLAMFYSGRPLYRDAKLIGRALTTRSLVPLSEIDRVLRFRRTKAALAYQESLEAVAYLIRRYGPGAPEDILKGLATGLAFPRAFERAIGRPFRLFELDLIQYWRRVHRWDLLEDLAWLAWVVLVFLAVLAYVLVRRRNRRRMAEWEAEEPEAGPSYWRCTTHSSEPGLEIPYPENTAQPRGKSPPKEES